MKLKHLLTMALLAVGLTANAQITPGENQLWWGFFNENSKTLPYGQGDKERYEVCFRIPGNSEVALGSTISAVRFYLRSTEGVEDVKVWLTEVLPAKNDYTYDYVKDLNIDELKVMEDGWNEISIDEPFTITEVGVYVGFSFTITDNSTKENQYPIVCSWGGRPDGNYNTLVYRVIDDEGCHAWWNYGSHAVDGNLAMQVLINGDNFPKNSMKIEDEFMEDVAVLGGEIKTDVKVTNLGIKGVQNFDYTITRNGIESEEMHFDMEKPLKALDEEEYVAIPVKAADEEGISRAKIKITKVNGMPNEEEDDNECSGMVITLAESAPRTVVVENFTSTQDAYAPRGLVAMERLKALYPENYVGINVHGGMNMLTNVSDPMYCYAYADLFGFVYNVMNAHSCLINRVVGCDTYLGTTDDIDAYQFDIQKDINAAMAEPTEGTVTIKSVEHDDDMTQFDVEAEVNFLYNRSDAPYALAYVLVQDEIESESEAIESGWPQYNAFRFETYRPYYEAEDFEVFLSGDEYVTGLTYKDVAVAGWGVFEGMNNTITAPIQKNVPQTVSKNLSLPMGSLVTKTTGLKLVVLLVQKADTGGEVINAAVYNFDSENAINGVTVENQTNGTTAIYDLSGRKVNANDIVRGNGGIYIVKQADGTTRKVMF